MNNILQLSINFTEKKLFILLLWAYDQGKHGVQTDKFRKQARELISNLKKHQEQISLGGNRC